LLFVTVSSTIAVVAPEAPYSQFERVKSVQKSKEEETVREKEPLPSQGESTVPYFIMVAVGSTSRSSPALRWVLAVTIIISAALCLAVLLCEDLTLPGVFQTISSGSIKAAAAGETAPSDHNQYGLGYSKARVIEKRQVPSFENGGVVLFFHLAKTGGTSIRQNFSRAFPHIEVKHIGTMEDLAEYSDLASRVLKGDRSEFSDGKTILFLELHGVLPSLFALHASYSKWRTIAEEFKTTFFSFALVREPISYSVSYFNFYNAEPCSFPVCNGQLVKPTEENLDNSLLFNHQCQLFAREHWELFGERHEKFDRQVTAAECEAVYQLVLSDMDWVGTTKAMSTETLPLLTQMFAHGAKEGNNMPQINKSWKPNHLTVDSLQPSTVEHIRSMNVYDQAIYEAVQRDFPVDMWEDFRPIDLP
jgi:hypothetical protein